MIYSYGQIIIYEFLLKPHIYRTTYNFLEYVFGPQILQNLENFRLDFIKYKNWVAS